MKEGDIGRFTLLEELFSVADGVFISIDCKESTNELC